MNDKQYFLDELIITLFMELHDSYIQEMTTEVFDAMQAAREKAHALLR